MNNGPTKACSAMTAVIAHLFRDFFFMSVVIWERKRIAFEHGKRKLLLFNYVF